jgi:hypothetical protein
MPVSPHTYAEPRDKFPRLQHKLRALPLGWTSHHNQALRDGLCPMNRLNRRNGRLAPLPAAVQNSLLGLASQQGFLAGVGVEAEEFAREPDYVGSGASWLRQAYADWRRR